MHILRYVHELAQHQIQVNVFSHALCHQPKSQNLSFVQRPISCFLREQSLQRILHAFQRNITSRYTMTQNCPVLRQLQPHTIPSATAAVADYIKRKVTKMGYVIIHR
jgi:hypothetical protein